MHNKKIFFLLFSLFFAFQITYAQKKSVQFSYSTAKINDSLQTLSIKATIVKGVYLLPAKKEAATDIFRSELLLDSSFQYLLFSTDSITVKGNLQTIVLPNKDVVKAYTDSVVFTYLLHTKTDSTFTLKGIFGFLVINGEEFVAGEDKFSVTTASKPKKESTEKTSSAKDMSIFSTFLLALIAGLLATLTPCVFPLIPVTVSFFLKRSKSKAEGIRNALTYSLSIITIYTIPTIILTLIFGNKILYQISTSAISNLLFFAIFIIFAISFFGAFELQLPNSWANKADEKAGKGGLLGTFFMALTLVIVSFSCTGPVVGTLLGQTSTQGISLAPILGMFGFGLGLALPFSLFAMFPSMLQSLPKSGGWLNSVKVCFGFIELALALKFLSNVDLIYHWRLLDRDVFLVFWIVIFVLLGFYLLGKLKFSHDSDIKFISVPRLFFAIAAFSFATYLIPGLWGAPLRHLSGFLPPDGTQDFNLEELKYLNSNTTKSTETNSLAKPPNRLVDKLHVPYGLTAYFSLEEGMAAAKVLNKPIMLDFTGHSCANCRKMEKEVWKDAAVLKKMKEDFVLISLYIDESTELPLNEQYTTKNGELITTEGAKNLDYEITKFRDNIQPLYMFLDTNGNLLSDIKYGYNPDIQLFLAHLEMVKNAFKSNTINKK